MNSNVKKIFLIIAIGVSLFCLGFSWGYFFDRIRVAGNQAGTAADVSGYDEATRRIERTANEIRNAAGNVREASGEIRISIDDAGISAGIAGDIADANVRALNGVGSLADGVQRIMGIMDAAEKRNAKMEADSGIGMD